MTAALNHLGADTHGRDLYLLELRAWADWPSELDLPSERFCLLVAGDARGEAPEAIATIASQALAAGCVYACMWGPGCELVHDTFDAKFNELEHSAGPVVMTTWHEDESLEQAFTFLMRDALPSDPWIASCRASLVAVIGNVHWAAEVRRLAQSEEGSSTASQ
jgi:hypothetical protein